MSELDRFFVELQGCRGEISEVKGLCLQALALTPRVDAIEKRHEKEDEAKADGRKGRRTWWRDVGLAVIGAVLTVAGGCALWALLP